MLINAILDFCYEVKNYMDARQPLTVEAHQNIEQVVVIPLKDAVTAIDNAAAQEYLDVMGGLVNASFEMRKV